MWWSWRRRLEVVAILLLEMQAAHSQSLTTRVTRIARDLAVNMVASAAFNELRYTACTNAGLRAQLDQTATRALDCASLPSGGAAAPSMPSYSENTPSIAIAQGVWTTRDLASCSVRHYTWTVAGTIGMSEFKDQFGQIDIERTLEVREDMLMTQTLSSYHPVDGHGEALGTRWTYVFLDRDHVQVHNLTTGASFPLLRCAG